MNENTRKYSPIDKLCLAIDQALRAFDTNEPAKRPYPAIQTEEASLTVAEKKNAAGLMRVNHAGEVAAQALYHGQSLASKALAVQQQMQQAALEESDHLAWCEQRLQELESRTSYLNPFWYLGSFTIGYVAGLAGDKWSLGFVAETETQVVNHLHKHLQLLPATDAKSAMILEQMQKDEAKHHDEAVNAGAAQLPGSVKKLMSILSKVMVKTAYWI